MQMQTMTMAEQVAAIHATHADEDARTVNCNDLVIHQGDVYLHRVPDDWARGEMLGTRQVAVGSTIGARHIADGDGVEVYAGCAFPPHVDVAALRQSGIDPKQLLGPVVVVGDDGMTLTHPEHAHHAIGFAGCWQVTYQADYLTMQRQED